MFIAVIAVIVAGSCLALGAAEGIIASAPDVSTIDVSPEGYATKIYDDGGNEIQTLSTSGSNRIYVDVEDIPITLQHAFIAIEDERFYEHNGIDIKGIFRAGTVFLSTAHISILCTPYVRPPSASEGTTSWLPLTASLGEISVEKPNFRR